MDTIDEWKIPDVFETYYPSGCSGFDKDGAPIIILPFAGIDIWGILHSVSKAEMIKMTIRTLERYLDLARKQTEIHGSLAGQLIVIIDMTGFNIRQYAWRPGKLITLLYTPLPLMQNSSF